MYRRIEKIIGIVASILLFALMLITFLDVLGRNAFSRPLPGASELTEILLAVVIFLMLPQVAIRNRHIVVDLVESMINNRTRIFLDMFAALASAIFFALVAWQMWALGTKAFGYGDATPTLHIPLGPILYGVAILSAINAIAFLLTIPIAGSDRRRELAGSDESYESAETPRIV
ncbi:TRAP transporter small permease [Pseudochelatococcus sp. B33]